MSAGKIFRLSNGSHLAGAGYYDQIVEVVAWLNAGSDPKERPVFPADLDEGSELLLIQANGEAFWLTWPYLRPVKINEDFAAVGSGSEFALGALAMGATAKRAVEIASRFDQATGKGINAVRIVK